MSLPIVLLVAVAVGLVVAQVVVHVTLSRAKRAIYQPPRDDCARCNQPLPPFDFYWLEGKRICTVCAGRAQRRLGRAIWVLVGMITVFAVLGIVLPITLLIRGDPSWWLGFLVIEGCTAVLALVFVTGLRTMKWENSSGRDLYTLDLRLRRLLRIK